MKKFLEKCTPIGVIIGCGLLVAVTNWVPGTLLSGGDNLHPEFNFGLNISRSIFAVWQEYQGVGLLGGMGHGADLIRQLFLWFLSIFLPVESLRYVWTVLMLIVGGLGAYALSMFLLAKNGPSGINQRLASMSAGLFYMLNLGTLQSFYVPFEVFSAHFGFLPWLLLVTVRFITQPSKSNWWWLFLIFFLSGPSGIVPTLFLVYWIIFGILLLGLFRGSGLVGWIKKLLTTASAVALAFVLSNGYWLFQFIYFTLRSSGVNVNSKINQMATQNIFLQNKEYGDISDVLMLKSFWFQGFEPNLTNVQGFMMQPWISHLNSPVVTGFSWVLVSLIVLGWLISLFKGKSLRVFGIVLVVIFGLMATSAQPFEYLNELMRNHLPLFGQIFRFTFTKFSIALSLLYSLMIGISIYFLISRYDKIRGNLVSKAVLVGIFLSLLFVVSLPTFKGEFFYQRTQVIRPIEYQEAFNYFQNQRSDVRIANFPQSSFWSWQYYKWGYSGSGFLWYGLSQPILDRAFDPWSKYSENYYLEITEAVYSRNTEALKSVLNKYQVGFILIDKNVMDNFSQRITYFRELEEMLDSMEGVSKEKDFGNIRIYKISLRNPSKDFVRVTNDLTIVNQYEWSSFDKAYQTVGDYAVVWGKSEVFFPFRNLVRHKSNAPSPYQISDSTSSIFFESDITSQVGDLNLSDWSSDEVRTMYRLSMVTENGLSTLRMELLFPTVYVDDQIVGGVKELDIYSFVSGQNIKIDTSEGNHFDVNDSSFMSYGFVLNDQDSEFTIRNESGELLDNIVISKAQIDALNDLSNVHIDGNKKLTVEIPKYLDPQQGYISNFSKFISSSCDLSRKGKTNVHKDQGYELWSENAKVCLAIDYPAMWHNQGFVSLVDSVNERGLPLLYWISDNTSDYQPVNMYLSSGKQFLVVPSLEDFGLGYSFHFDNASIGEEETQNTLNQFSVYPIPYKWLLSIQLGVSSGSVEDTTNFSAKRINTAMYQITYSGMNEKTLILEQGYDLGWVAYDIGEKPTWLKTFLPMFFGHKVNDHIQVNNLVNGWKINSRSETVFMIVYLPQYLQFAGFGMLGLSIGVGIIIFGRKLARTIVN